MAVIERTPREEGLFIDYLISRKLNKSTINQYMFRYRQFPFPVNQQTVNYYLSKHPNQVPYYFVKVLLEYKGLNKVIDIPRITGHKEERLPEKLDYEQVQKIRDGMYQKDKLLGLMFDIQQQATLRRSELVSIKIDDFEWKTWNMDRTKSLRLKILGKGRRERMVKISPTLAKSLDGYITPRELAGYYNVEKRLYPYTSEAWYNTLRKVSDETIGIKIKSHSIRKYGATQYWNTGIVNIIDLRNILGHKDISTTQRYIQDDPEVSLNKIGDILEHQKQ